MRQFRYTAVDGAGKPVSGKMEAESSSEVYDKIKEQGLYCTGATEIRQAGEGSGGYRIKVRQLALFCRQLGAMLSAGLPITRALDILYEKAQGKRMKKVLLGLCEDIQEGLSFYEAMRNQDPAFPVLLMQMVQAGEVTGSIDRVMGEMSVHYEKEYKLANKITASLAYPILLVCMTVAVVIFLFVFVLPQFFSLFGDAELPAITVFMMNVSHFLVNDWMWLLLGIMAVVIVWTLLLRVPWFRLFIDTAKIKLPVIGKSNVTIYTSRFCSSMAILYGSGISMIQAIEISVSVLNNKRLEKMFEGVIEAVHSGDMLSSSIEKLGIFDGMVSSMIYVGEESGSLDQTLRKLSEFYADESETALAKMTALLEPCMIIFIAIIIGLVIASVMLPMYTMYATIA